MSSKQIRLIKILVLLLIFTAVAFGASTWKERRDEEKNRISYTAFVDKVNAGEISKVRSEGDAITAHGQSGARFILHRPMDAELSKLLLARHIDFAATPPAAPSHWVELCLLLVVLVPIFLIMKKLALFGRSKAKLSDRSSTDTCFTDVAGADEAKSDLLETVEFLRDPGKFSRLGGKMLTGILLVGPPGTGKTLLARAVAGEAGVPFFSMSGSEFVEMYVGVGSSRVRDLFAQGHKAAPCIIFIDELDAVGRKRDAGGNGANDERDQTLNQLLVEMDGFCVNKGVVVIAATNRPEVLDPALLRPGRFDRQVTVGTPDIKGREDILKVHTRDVPLDEGVDLRLVARGTPGFSGADLANLINEAAIIAAKGGKPTVEMADLDMARDKVLMGAERKSMVLSDQVKLSTAWHEAGHVMVAKLVPGCDPVHKVSIIPRGRALGVTVQIPEEDIYSYTKEMLLAHIKVLMGGRAAEDLVFNTTTTGAGNDLARATDVARKMVCEWGMSEAFGPVAFGSHESTKTGDGAAVKGFSDATAVEIDTEIRSIVTTSYDQVRRLLQANMETMEALTRELVARETLGSADIDTIFSRQ
ncbi:cell division ATP-dependent zinc protease FtsH [Geotalea daltonii FRC-32]|uniref:ATP-dependent zinc metalloprotease FtsH n=1 Tax=Geotalea daltonii (strain DSM 22248 / JCM 15807 / FRC-32) TaxID=316067 RepID=B9LZ70_GEODF|nr:cell division ATP-dependent zinc protease FtsH [Geotalea daltonii FRC-32]